MVRDYRSCKLTFEKDRVIAFSGIASGMTYLAGLWKESAHVGLLWCVKPAGAKGGSSLPVPGMQDGVKAPPWSWFSLEALFDDFAGLRVKLSTYRIPARLRWENDLVQLLPYGQPMLPEKSHLDDDPRTAIICNLDNLSLSNNNYLPEKRKYDPPSVCQESL
ncbi:hypothetical protein ACMFMF_011592 [Clarireedia jacksonii]